MGARLMIGSSSLKFFDRCFSQGRRGICAGGGKDSDGIPLAIDVHISQAKSLKVFGQPVGALGLSERRRRDGNHLTLPVHQPAIV